MESSQFTKARAGSKRRRNIIAGVILLIIIIICVVVPCAILIPRAHRRAAASILLPLYIYPIANSTWDPLYNAVQDYPHLEFTVVINPDNGPGNESLPDAQYATQITRLNTLTNVKTLGYVRTGYATRDINDVLANVNTYAAWPSQNASLYVNGIFMDESPYEANETAALYMRQLSSAVKAANGLHGDKMVVRNPGSVPSSLYNDTNTDVVVILEDQYSAYASKAPQVQSLSKERSHNSIILNSVANMSQSDLNSFTNGLANTAQYLFLTSNVENYYESFGSDFGNFVQAIGS